MSRTAKWILGIVIGVLVVAVIVTVGYFVFTRGYGMAGMMDDPSFRFRGEERAFPRGYMPMHPNGRPFGGMHGLWGFGFSPLGWILNGVVRLGLIALFVLGVIALIRAIWPKQTAAPSTDQSFQVVQEQNAAVSSVCSNCGFQVQHGWKHCPNCAQALTE